MGRTAADIASSIGTKKHKITKESATGMPSDLGMFSEIEIGEGLKNTLSSGLDDITLRGTGSVADRIPVFDKKIRDRLDAVPAEKVLDSLLDPKVVSRVELDEIFTRLHYAYVVDIGGMTGREGMRQFMGAINDWAYEKFWDKVMNAKDWKPDTLRKALGSPSDTETKRLVKILQTVSEETMGTVGFMRYNDLHDYANKLAEFSKPKGLKDRIKQGRNIASNLPIGIMGGAGVGIWTQDYVYALLGMLGGGMVEGLLSSNPQALKYILKEPPGWKAYAKKAGVLGGRATQRLGRAVDFWDSRAELENARSRVRRVEQ